MWCEWLHDYHAGTRKQHDAVRTVRDLHCRLGLSLSLQFVTDARLPYMSVISLIIANVSAVEIDADELLCSAGLNIKSRPGGLTNRCASLQPFEEQTLVSR